MKRYTYRQLVDIMEKSGCNLADTTVGRMMDIVEDKTGDFPAWGDIAPDWVVKNCIGELL